MEEEDKHLLIEYYKLILSSKDDKGYEIGGVLERIGFDPTALHYFKNLVTILDRNFFYNKSDLYLILDRHLQKEVGRVVNARMDYWDGLGDAWVGCTATCDKITGEHNHGDATAKLNFWSGCFACCMASCGPQQ